MGVDAEEEGDTSWEGSENVSRLNFVSGSRILERSLGPWKGRLNRSYLSTEKVEELLSELLLELIELLFRSLSCGSLLDDDLLQLDVFPVEYEVESPVWLLDSDCLLSIFPSVIGSIE